MEPIRQSVRRHAAFGSWLLAAAMLVKLLVPAGYMLGRVDGRTTIILCSGYGPVSAPMPAHDVAMPGMAGHGAEHDGGHDDRQRADPPCAFAGLAMPSLATGDPALAIVAPAFVALAPLAALRTTPAARNPHLRPPARGPPPLPHRS